ncbi:MAG: ChaN family lipoprotein, partial [Hyphomicrobiales bacterium]|nr:ChaN family lipoprotein [Hyphomicrobiales bacterium]
MGSMQRTGPQETTHRRGGLALRAAAVALAAIVSMPAAYAHEPAHPDSAACDAVAMWFEPATGRIIATDRLIAALARRPVVLLGETHDNAEHHRWQLHTLAALHGRNPDMVLGFESFPRRVQPTLDQWVNGELGTEAFLEAVDWPTIWGFDAALYLPLFHFARQNRIPMIALNVDRSLVSKVGEEGWAAITADEKAGLSDPAEPSAAYRESLARTYIFKQTHGETDNTAAAVEEADTSSVIGTDEFGRFVEAQLTWDRAMAEALAAARQRRPAALVVGIIGSGHIRYRHGVPHQLADLGIADAAVLLPIDRMEACDALPAD